jgi:hypothetical protein
LRRAEIAALRVGDLHQNRGFDSLRVSRKGGRRDALAINPQTTARLRAYLEASGHGADIDGPLFRPLKHNGKRRDQRRGMDPDAIDRVVRKYATELGLDRGYSAHSGVAPIDVEQRRAIPTTLSDRLLEHCGDRAFSQPHRRAHLLPLRSSSDGDPTGVAPYKNRRWSDPAG